MKSCIIIGTLLLFGKLSCAQSSAKAVPSSKREVMTDKSGKQPDAAKAADNSYLMSKDFKGSSKPEEKAEPRVNSVPKEEDQKNERVPR